MTRIVLKNLREGSSYEISTVFKDGVPYKELLDADLVGDITVSGNYVFVNDELIVQLSASYDIVAHCDLCGDTTIAHSHCVLDEIYTRESPLYNAKEDSVNLDPLISECIVLAAARSVQCRDNCKGLCPVCGANLNKGSCGCKIKKTDESNPFGILERLINTGGAKDGITKK